MSYTLPNYPDISFKDGLSKSTAQRFIESLHDPDSVQCEDIDIAIKRDRVSFKGGSWDSEWPPRLRDNKDAIIDSTITFTKNSYGSVSTAYTNAYIVIESPGIIFYATSCMIRNVTLLPNSPTRASLYVNCTFDVLNFNTFATPIFVNCTFKRIIGKCGGVSTTDNTAFIVYPDKDWPKIDCTIDQELSDTIDRLVKEAPHNMLDAINTLMALFIQHVKSQTDMGRKRIIAFNELFNPEWL